MNESAAAPSPIGAVFTPPGEALKLIRDRGIYKRWLEGAVVLDPTAGSGHFMEAFIELHLRREGCAPPAGLLKNLHAVEREERFVAEFLERIGERYGIQFPAENFICADFIFSPPDLRADILLGNPPWVNFCDLDPAYKEKIKPYFINSGLTGSRKNLLLGNSRIDMASLIIAEALRKNLKPGGRAYFFLPLSLFLGDGAHSRFRILLEEEKVSLDRIDDYRGIPLFPGIATRYGFAAFTSGKRTVYPVDYRVIRKSGPAGKFKASPVSGPGSPLSIGRKSRTAPLPVLELLPESRPRQGLNTCGANDLFIFDRREPLGSGIWRMSNKFREALLPEELVYPLIGAGQFRGEKEHRWVFLPYDGKGRVLTIGELSRYPEACEYVKINREKLEKRKGVLIGSAIARGNWWALLGVGPYSFAPWKVVWEAYGKKDFSPRLFSGESGKLWQPNQALQAFIPHGTREEAERTLKNLSDPRIGDILRSQGMEGTCNWAQPGRMMKFIRFRKTD